MTAGKPGLLVKATTDTKFHIDYDWWTNSSEDLRSYLLSHLPQEHRERLSLAVEGSVIDYIDPQTAEVFQLDELGLSIQEAAKSPDFLGQHTSLVDCIFRALLANGNVPKSPKELNEITGRPASLILKTLGGPRVYKGIRPFFAHEEDTEE